MYVFNTVAILAQVGYQFVPFVWYITMIKICNLFNLFETNNLSQLKKNTRTLKKIFKNSDNLILICQCGCGTVFDFIRWCRYRLDGFTPNEQKKNRKRHNIQKFMFESIIDINKTYILSTFERHKADMYILEYYLEDTCNACCKNSALIIKLLLRYSSKNTFRSIIHTHTIFITPLIHNGVIYNSSYEEIMQLMNKLRNIGYNFIEREPRLLFYAIINKNIELLKILLTGQFGFYDVNHISPFTTMHHLNYAQHLLYVNRYTKNPNVIKHISYIFELLLHNGLNMDYTEKFGRTISDYIYEYGWISTRIYNIIIKYYLILLNSDKFSSKLVIIEQIRTKIMEYMFTKHVNENRRMGLLLFERISPNVYESCSEVQRLLYDHRYTKDHVVLSEVVQQYKALPRNIHYMNLSNKTFIDFMYEYWPDFDELYQNPQSRMPTPL